MEQIWRKDIDFWEDSMTLFPILLIEAVLLVEKRHKISIDLQGWLNKEPTQLSRNIQKKNAQED